MSTSPEKEPERIRDEPVCSCCGSTLQLYSRGFSSKVTIEDMVYYCNNPQCCCDNRPR